MVEICQMFVIQTMDKEYLSTEYESLEWNSFIRCYLVFSLFFVFVKYHVLILERWPLEKKCHSSLNIMISSNFILYNTLLKEKDQFVLDKISLNSQTISKIAHNQIKIS